MRVLHVSAECYPAAKAGGLGDVVGALPKYQNDLGIEASVVIPKYRVPWIKKHAFKPVFSGAFFLQNDYIPYAVEAAEDVDLGFPFFLINIKGAFDRSGIYGEHGGGYADNTERFLFFQQAVLDWVMHMETPPQVLHCHDYHAGLIPFMAANCPTYAPLKELATVFTIHNGEYHGSFFWDRADLIPHFDAQVRGLLDWNGYINPLAAGIKAAWKVTTVSPAYLQELSQYANGLENLVRSESAKAVGILNGIDTAVWDPKTDHYLPHRLESKVAAFKKANKEALRRRFSFNPELPVITFIGRLVREKGADLLPDLIRSVLDSGTRVAFLILGTGEHHIHEAFRQMQPLYQGRFDAALEYNEGLAHTLYAGSDFLLMPSRVEPCGLNQMYAMRYGSLPIVRSVGGLKDTVIDLGADPKAGTGFRFDPFQVEAATRPIWRAAQFYFESPDAFKKVRSRNMKLDFSWERSAATYQEIYTELLKNTPAL